MHIGFVGLGLMGLPMATRLVGTGHTVVGYDLSLDAMQRFAQAGGRTADSAAQAAAEADLIITIVPDAPHIVEAAIEGEHAVSRGIRPGTILIDASTVDPATSRRLAAHFAGLSVAVADAPVARTVKDAEAGTLATMVGCRAELFETIRPVLACYADTITWCGDNGAGSAMKLVNNFINQGTIALLAEALTAGAANGLSLELMTQVLSKTNACNANLVRALPKKAFSGDFAAGFMLRLAAKDQRLALAMMEEVGIDPVTGRATMAAMERAMAQGHGQQDLCSLFLPVEAQAGVEARLSPADSGGEG